MAPGHFAELSGFIEWAERAHGPKVGPRGAHGPKIIIIIIIINTLVPIIA